MDNNIIGANTILMQNDGLNIANINNPEEYSAEHMSTKDVISIITTAYNCEKFVEYAMNSVIKQLTSEFIFIEYIVVNDASTDGTLAKIEEVAKTVNNKDINVKIYTLDKNVGCGSARKYGIEKATGKYFMFLDADDYYINNDFVIRAHIEITSSNADIVDYGIRFNSGHGEIFYSQAPQRIEIINPEYQVLALFKDNKIKFNVWSKIYTRNIINTYPYSDTRTYEDIRTVPIWLYNAKKLVIMPSCEVNYRANESSIIRKDDFETRLGTITAISDLFEIFKDNMNILKAMYQRAMIDLEVVLVNHSSKDKYFNEMSALNTKMLSYIYPEDYKKITYNIER